MILEQLFTINKLFLGSNLINYWFFFLSKNYIICDYSFDL